MDFQLVTTHIKNHWRLKLEKLFSKPCDIDLIKESQDNNSWLYFRRTNPRKFEIYIDEDFELKNSENVMSNQINMPNFLPNEIKVHPDDLLCINVEGEWSDFVRFEEEWVENIEMDTIVWDHYLVAEGNIGL